MRRHRCLLACGLLSSLALLLLGTLHLRAPVSSDSIALEENSGSGRASEGHLEAEAEEQEAIRLRNALPPRQVCRPFSEACECSENCRQCLPGGPKVRRRRRKMRGCECD